LLIRVHRSMSDGPKRPTRTTAEPAGRFSSNPSPIPTRSNPRWSRASSVERRAVEVVSERRGQVAMGSPRSSLDEEVWMPSTKSCLFKRNSRCEDLQCLHRYTPLRFARKPHHWQCVCHSRWEEVHSARRGGGALRRVARGRSSVAALSLEDLAGVFDEHRGDVLVRDAALLEGGYHTIVEVSVVPTGN
jgi:hypothetical protein